MARLIDDLGTEPDSVAVLFFFLGGSDDEQYVVTVSYSEQNSLDVKLNVSECEVT
jgi:hypothetical protein